MLQLASNYLISPLPEFTGGLPSSLDGFTALPEVDEELERKIQHYRTLSDEVLDPIASSCGEPNCPLSCQCVPFPLTPTAAQVASTQPPEDPISRGPTPSTAHLGVLEQPYTTPSNIVTPIIPNTSSRVPSGLSLTRQPDGLDRRPQRSQSFSSRPSSRSRSRPPSLDTTRPNSPLRISVSRADTYPFFARETPGQDVEQRMRSRLHDILQDTTVSSSLPNMSSAHQFMSARHDPVPRSTADISRPPSSSASSSSRAPPPPPRSAGAVLSSSTLPGPPARINIASSVPSPCTTTHVPATASTPTATSATQAISHASSAALALEKAQRAEKERQKSERERNREERRADKDRRSDKEREWSDRLRPDAERVRTQVPSSSTTPALTSSSSHSSTTHRDIPHREHTHRDATSHKDDYSPSTSIPSSSGTLRRDGSIHQRVAPASLRDSTIHVGPHSQYSSFSRSSGRKIATTMGDNRVAGLYA
ncbi:hypothetical protein HGRIS_014282 [Hohenbuehelia grisea]|uniref:Uncharacterized protein n=1 Tax=Hohenbuehelia grisea TaxID=104357 RepID=A0ABR3JSX8_9AGAR